MKNVIAPFLRNLLRIGLILFLGISTCLAQGTASPVLPHSEPDVSDSNPCLSSYKRPDNTSLSTLRKNAWIRQVSSDTVVIYVHGILSDNVDAWLTQAQPCAYWPDILAADDEFAGASVYLAGYYSKYDSGSSSIADAAGALWVALSTVHGPLGLAATDYKNIVFVAHSLGGVVVRKMLASFGNQLSDRNLAVLLVASPSNGSDYATLISWLTKYFPNSLAKELSKDSETLTALNEAFRTFQKSRFNGTKLRVMELFETRFPKYLCRAGGFFCAWTTVRLPSLVPADSAGLFDLQPKRVGDTDHLTIAKPQNANAESHLYARAFLQTFLAGENVRTFASALGNVVVTGVTRRKQWQKFGNKTDFVSAYATELCSQSPATGQRQQCNPWIYSSSSATNPTEDGDVGFILIANDLRETIQGKHKFDDVFLPNTGKGDKYDGKDVFSTLIRTARDTKPEDKSGLTVMTSYIQPVIYSTSQSLYRGQATVIPSAVNSEFVVTVPSNVSDVRIIETSVSGTYSVALIDLIEGKQLGVLRFTGSEEKDGKFLLRFRVTPRKRSL